MSVRKAFEKLGTQEPKILETLRQAEGIVNEFEVSIELTHWLVPKEMPWQVDIFLSRPGRLPIESHDWEKFPTKDEAERRFDLLVIQHDLNEKSSSRRRPPS